MSVVAESADLECVGTLQVIAELYAAHAIAVRRLVHLHVVAPDAVVEDACQVAWMRLVGRRARVRRRTARQWLVRVAVNEARHLMRVGGRERPFEEFDLEEAETPDLLEELAERHSRLGAIQRLPERQRRLLWLQGLGFSYVEMAGVTGDSRRTVERQLARARERLAGA